MLIVKEKEKEKPIGSMTLPLMWLDGSIATINATLQLLEYYYTCANFCWSFEYFIIYFSRSSQAHLIESWVE